LGCHEIYFDKFHEKLQDLFHGGNELSAIAESPVARELAPAGPRSGPNSIAALVQGVHGEVFWGCCAAQREQAPSPQWGVKYEEIELSRKMGGDC
jgi:hypothetical protein